MENILKTMFGGVAALLSYIFGKPDIWMAALITVIVLDYLTGLGKAYILGELSSKAGLKGILKKMMYFAIVAIAVIADNITGAESFLRMVVIGFLIANEALSILENCAAAELPVPNVLIRVLEKLKDQGEVSGELKVSNQGDVNGEMKVREQWEVIEGSKRNGEQKADSEVK